VVEDEEGEKGQPASCGVEEEKEGDGGKAPHRSSERYKNLMN